MRGIPAWIIGLPYMSTVLVRHQRALARNVDSRQTCSEKSLTRGAKNLIRARPTFWHAGKIVERVALLFMLLYLLGATALGVALLYNTFNRSSPLSKNDVSRTSYRASRSGDDQSRNDLSKPVAAGKEQATPLYADSAIGPHLRAQSADPPRLSRRSRLYLY